MIGVFGTKQIKRRLQVVTFNHGGGPCVDKVTGFFCYRVIRRYQISIGDGPDEPAVGVYHDGILARRPCEFFGNASYVFVGPQGGAAGIHDARNMQSLEQTFVQRMCEVQPAALELGVEERPAVRLWFR